MTKVINLKHIEFLGLECVNLQSHIKTAIAYVIIDFNGKCFGYRNETRR